MDFLDELFNNYDIENATVTLTKTQFDTVINLISTRTDYRTKHFKEVKFAPKDNKKLRVYYHILGTETYYQSVKTAEEAKLVIDSIANFVNMKVNEGVFPDHCSTAGLEEYDEDDGEWYDWYDDDGYDFDQHFEQ